MPSPLPKLDRLGRPQSGHWLGDGLTLAFTCAEAGISLSTVPSEYWSLDVDEGHEPVAIVACPCGEDQLITLLAGPHLCASEECERAYVFDSKDVWVLNSPVAATSVAT